MSASTRGAAAWSSAMRSCCCRPCPRSPRTARRARRPAPARPGSGPSETRLGWPRSPAPRGGARTSRRGPRLRGADRSHPRRCLPSRPWSPTRSWFRRTLHGTYDPAVALEMVDTWVDAAGVPAVAAAIVGPEGVREQRAAGEAEPGSLFALASLTKPIVAPAVLVGVEEGALELDEPVGRHLAAYAAGPRAAVTPRHLLSHASGLPESGPAGVPALEVELARPPGTRRVYSNEGYAVLGELLAAATGIPHPDYVRQAVFEPLGMDAYLGLPEHEDTRALRVREPGMWRPGLQLFNSIEWRRRATAAGGAFATVDAYARIVQVLLARGAPLIAPETAADMARTQFPGIPGGIESFQTWHVAAWGLGCDIRS